MDISFPDAQPVDPIDGDYVHFAAVVDGKPVKCCVPFGVLAPRSKNINCLDLAYWKKKDRLREVARAMIEAGEVRDGEIVITSLKQDQRQDQDKRDTINDHAAS